MNLANKVALVTGAGSGIGRAIALRFAADGAAVACVGTRHERIDESVRLIQSAGGSGLAIVCDVSDELGVKATVDATVQRLGRLDILINNAARNRPEQAVDERVANLDEDWWQTTLDVNLTGAFHCCKYGVAAMLAGDGGVILNIASTSGLAGNTNQSAYAASKHGLVGLTKSIALDYGDRNIRAVAICPGFIETERSLGFVAHNRSADWLDKKRREIPLQRLGRPEEVAALAAFLASDDASFISGVAVAIDGGSAARRG